MGRSKRATEPTTVLGLITESENAVNVSELAVAMLGEFGGMAQFASAYKAEYDQAKPGSISRSKMLEGVMRLVAMAAPKNHNADLGGLGDEDLIRVLGTILTKAGAVDGEAETEIEPAAE